MLRFLKWLVPIGTAVLIVLFASAYWYVTPQRMKAIVQPRLSSALGREVMFDHIAWGLSEGIVFSDLRVEGGDGSDPLLVAEQVQVPVSRWKLLSVLGALALEGEGPGMDEQSDADDAPILSIDRVRFQDGTLRVRGIAIVFDHLETALQVENRRVNLDPIQGQVCEGTLTGDLAWDHGAWDGSVSLANAQAEQVVHSIGWDIPLSGAVDIAIQVSGAGVRGSASMAEGHIVRWAFLQRLLHPMAQWGLIKTDEVPLKDVTVVFQVQGDEVILDGTKFTASDIACVLNGKTLGGQLDYVLDVEMPIQFAGFRLGSRTIPLRIKMTGMANAPEVAVEIR